MVSPADLNLSGLGVGAYDDGCAGRPPAPARAACTPPSELVLRPALGTHGVPPTGEHLVVDVLRASTLLLSAPDTTVGTLPRGSYAWKRTALERGRLGAAGITAAACGLEGIEDADLPAAVLFDAPGWPHSPPGQAEIGDFLSYLDFTPPPRPAPPARAAAPPAAAPGQARPLPAAPAAAAAAAPAAAAPVPAVAVPPPPAAAPHP
eukprot:gene43045-9787_t